MSADNRTVHTDALATLGTIISENEKRDAIHLAVIPTVAQHSLRPGEHVQATGDVGPNPVGIVDPFLPARGVRRGEWFWLVIYPRQINSLRHVWTHPAFPDEKPQEIEQCQTKIREDAETRLRAITDSWEGPDYDTFVKLAINGRAGDENDSQYYGNSWNIEGEYIYSYGRDASGEIPPEAWDLVETITGKKVKDRPQYFSCSC